MIGNLVFAREMVAGNGIGSSVYLRTTASAAQQQEERDQRHRCGWFRNGSNENAATPVGEPSAECNLPRIVQTITKAQIADRSRLPVEFKLPMIPRNQMKIAGGIGCPQPSARL